ncbi:MAG: hypothetical protein NC248_11220 [Bacteroides sp.]|nr:hypothetical protein [Bacteroides sp.]MCM1391020.1 hypothetical protein [Bacteroides sp.]
MKSLKRLLTSFNRYKRSKGFGVHSPFAFYFILNVLRERLPYYAYANIEVRRNMALNLSARISRHRRVISIKNAKMLFRIACYFNPKSILQIGTTYGVSTTAMLDVSRHSQLVICPGTETCTPIYKKVTHRYGDRIIHCADIESSIKRFDTLSAAGCKFILVNSIDTDNDSAILYRYLMEALDEGATVILRNILKPTRVAALNNKINENLDHGMTFTNGKISIVVGRKSLPRQSFNLWF